MDNKILQIENQTKNYADFKLDHVSFSSTERLCHGTDRRKWGR